MTVPHDPPVPYRVVYSERVRNELKELVAKAARHGLGREALNAVKTIDERLHIFPQFGQPLRDLRTPGETLWVATVWPLVARYIIDEERRLVWVITSFKPLPNLGL